MNLCSGHGKCLRGYCACDFGWFGIDCGYNLLTNMTKNEAFTAEVGWRAQCGRLFAAQGLLELQHARRLRSANDQHSRGFCCCPPQVDVPGDGKSVDVDWTIALAAIKREPAFTRVRACGGKHGCEHIRARFKLEQRRPVS